MFFAKDVRHCELYAFIVAQKKAFFKYFFKKKPHQKCVLSVRDNTHISYIFDFAVVIEAINSFRNLLQPEYINL